MEVHHHSHSSDPDPLTSPGHRGRKKWTHYFWEFLMLFLAVFCGFLAEYQLEHKIERDRAKEYARALYDDIVSDTANLNSTIQNLKKLISYEDTLISLLDEMTIDKKKIPEAKLYYYVLRSQGGSLLSLKTSTLNQLKNSGTLRLFKNKKLVRLVTEYDQAINNESSRADDNQYTRDEQTQCFRQVFNYTNINRVETLLKQHPASRDSVLNLEMALLNRDERSLSDLSYAIRFRIFNLQRRVDKYYSEPLETGIKLLEALEEEYKLK